MKYVLIKNFKKQKISKLQQLFKHRAALFIINSSKKQSKKKKEKKGLSLPLKMVASTALNCKIPTISPSPSHSNNKISSSIPHFPVRFRRVSSNPSPLLRSNAVSCTLTREPSLAMEDKLHTLSLQQRPDSFGRFGRFGGKYVPETLMHALTELEAAFYSLAGDQDFQVWGNFLFL